MGIEQITVEKFEPLGAAIVGADIGTLLSADGVPELVLGALEENGVLVFPELALDDDQQVAFSERLGGTVTKKGSGVYGRDAKHPEIYHVGFSDELNNVLQVKGAFFWHIDGTTDDIPSKASLLTARSLSATGGGDTQFVNTYVAYDRLSDAEQQHLAHLRVEHSLESAYRWFDPDPPADVVERLRSVEPKVHPLVWTHRSGRKSLVLGTTASRIEGLSDEDGAAILRDLLERATEPEQVFTHRWSVGDLVIWDNRGTLHRATAYAEDSGRMMHRVTLAGDEPIE
jgi:alpha-ketoglutarate-dependent taurine dioxygenase